MVAATILVVIVMMLGMLFQQTSVAWRTGLMRSDGYMQPAPSSAHSSEMLAR